MFVIIVNFCKNIFVMWETTSGSTIASMDYPPPFINEDKFRYICNYYEISPYFANHLRKLIQFKIVIIADDSGSMNTLTDYNEPRWNELCKFITTVFSITNI